MPVAKRPTTPQPRSGQHPIDARLVEANLFGWFMPFAEICQRQFLILLLAGLAALALQFILPWLAFSSPLFESRIWPRLVDAFVTLALTSGMFAGAYALLARTEGRAHGLAAIEPPGRIFIKATGLALVWAGVGLAIAVALAVVGYAVFKAFGGGLGGVNIASLMLLGMVGLIGVLVVFFLFAPFWIGLSIRYSLSFVRIVRTEEGSWTAFRLAWQRVSAESWRYFWPSYALVVVLIGVAFLLAFQQALIGESKALSYLFSVIGFGCSLSIAFVIERVYDTALGLEPDVDPSATDSPHAPDSPTPSASGVVAGATAAAAGHTVKAASPATPQSAGPPVTAEQFAALLEQHTYSPRELGGLLGRCTDLAAGLVAARSQLLPLAQGPRLAEAVILVETALKNDPRFFAPTPDLVTPLAKRVASAGRPDLAVKMLQPFVRDHRDHKLHLTAALFAAHLVAQNLKKPDTAKQFLLQLKQLYPNEQLIDQQLKRLPS